MFGGAPGNGRVSWSDGNIGADFESSPETNIWTIKPVPKQSSPAAIEAWQRFVLDFARSPKDKQLRFSLSAWCYHRIPELLAAIYQSAYLLMFSHFGYEFVSHSHYGPMRERILHPINDTWQVTIHTISDQSAAVLLGGKQQRVLFINESNAIMALLRFRPKGGKARVLGVVLPGLDNPSPGDVPKDFQCSVWPYRADLLTNRWDCLSLAWHETGLPTA